jgi:hypothetical protein
MLGFPPRGATPPLTPVSQLTQEHKQLQHVIYTDTFTGKDFAAFYSHNGVLNNNVSGTVRWDTKNPGLTNEQISYGQNRPSKPAGYDAPFPPQPNPHSSHWQSPSFTQGPSMFPPVTSHHAAAGTPAYPAAPFNPSPAAAAARPIHTGVTNLLSEFPKSPDSSVFYEPSSWVDPARVGKATLDIATYSDGLADEAINVGKGQYADIFRNEAGVARQLDIELRNGLAVTASVLERLQKINNEFGESIAEVEKGYPAISQPSVPQIYSSPPAQANQWGSQPSPQSPSFYGQGNFQSSQSGYGNPGAAYNSAYLQPQSPVSPMWNRYDAPQTTQDPNTAGYGSYQQYQTPSYGPPSAGHQSTEAFPSMGNLDSALPPINTSGDFHSSRPYDSAWTNPGRIHHSLSVSSAHSAGDVSPMEAAPGNLHVSNAGKNMIQRPLQNINNEYFYANDRRNVPGTSDYKRQSGGKGDWKTEEFKNRIEGLISDVEIIDRHSDQPGSLSSHIASMRRAGDKINKTSSDKSNFQHYQRVVGLAHTIAEKAAGGTTPTWQGGGGFLPSQQINGYDLTRVADISNNVGGKLNFYMDPANDPKGKGTVKYNYDTAQLKYDADQAISQLSDLARIAEANGKPNFAKRIGLHVANAEGHRDKLNLMLFDSKNLSHVKEATKLLADDAFRLNDAFTKGTDSPDARLGMLAPSEEKQIQHMKNQYKLVSDKLESAIHGNPHMYPQSDMKVDTRRIFDMIKELPIQSLKQPALNRAFVSVINREKNLSTNKAMIGDNQQINVAVMDRLNEIFKFLTDGYENAVVRNQDYDDAGVQAYLADIDQPKKIDWKQLGVKAAPIAVKAVIMAFGGV